MQALRGSVVKYVTNIPQGPSLSHTGSSWYFHENVLGQDNSEPLSSTLETQEIHEYMNYCPGMTEIKLKP